MKSREVTLQGFANFLGGNKVQKTVESRDANRNPVLSFIFKHGLKMTISVVDDTAPSSDLRDSRDGDSRPRQRFKIEMVTP